jgi:cyclase
MRRASRSPWWTASVAAGLAAATLCEAQQDFSAVALTVLPVQGGVYMITGAGGNTSVQIGDEGVLVVDTQFAPLAPKIMAEIRKLSSGPIRFIVNTHDHVDHVGGNAGLAELIKPTPLEPLQMIAHENALARLSNPSDGEGPTPAGGLPADSYFTPTKDFHFNGEAVFLYHAPNAHTDGDTIVLFRESDVVSTGDLFTPGAYPFIDRARGGSVQGLIAGLNQILHLTVPAKTQERGTYVVPGHGRICDEADVVEFRDMIVIVRDRIADMITRGMTLRQIQAARPTLDYDTEYVYADSFIKADEFVAAVHSSLMESPR